jgi:hypothetical protein
MGRSPPASEAGAWAWFSPRPRAVLAATLRRPAGRSQRRRLYCSAAAELEPTAARLTSERPAPLSYAPGSSAGGI